MIIKRKFKSLFKRSSKTQFFRTACQISVILFFTLIPLHNWYANNKISYNQARLVGLAWGESAETIYSVLDSFYSFFWDDPVNAATSNNGSMWAFTFLGINFSDPVGVISDVINSVHFPTAYVLGAVGPIVLALLFGRVFCSWICPMSVLFSLTGKIRGFFEKIGVPVLSLRLPKETGGWVFLFGLILSNIFGAWVWHFTLPYITFSHEIFSYVVFSTFTVGIYYLIAVLVLDVGLLNGAFCSSICPTGWLLSQIGRLSVFKLKVDKSECPPKCSMCKTVCPMDLYPREGKIYSCHLCHKCVDICPKKHLKIDIDSLYKRST